MLSIPRVRHYLKSFQLDKLFTEELGWDRHAGELPVEVDGQKYRLRSFAEKRGVRIFECPPGSEGAIPDYATRRKIEKQVAKSAFEHLIIFIDAARTQQVWQWVARQAGQPEGYREHHFHAALHSGDPLIQKLEVITFPLSAEEGLTLAGVTFALRDAFDRDRLTKRFYDQFKQEHEAFLKFIQGITAVADREWYASLMLNRLMFIYFIQQKGFLDGDQRYLQNRLALVREQRGRDRFHSFYRYFLLRLFHEGFAQQPAQRAADLDALLGRIPYLNGGLFEPHDLEITYPEIDIPDQAFEQIFAFFDGWNWHLDERPLANDREINPDVLGYIFEKYINQKQMGAYYTKEDITEYIGKSTIVPHLFDAAQKKCAIAFEPGSALWRLMRDDPDRYIYEPVRRGVVDARGKAVPETALPDFVRAGMHDPKARMFERRYNLGEADLRDAEGRKLTLPTETWREYVSRRHRCLELREKLAAGGIHQINDLITYNLDLRQFAEDAISNCEGPDLLRAFYQSISTVTVLDPTCGSGAFLFAALNILEPLYESCLDRMQAFVDDLDRSGEPHSPKKFEDFRRILAEVEKHPSRRYFILKSIIVNNLYGVDIMEEAVEICKLRLFLKLVAQVDRVEQLEPLPDIDFNIRAGNTLVGYVSRDEIRRAAERESSGQGKLIFGETDEAIKRIEEEAEIVDRAFRKFHEMQTSQGMDSAEFVAGKRELRERLRKLDEELDRYVAADYGVSSKKKKEYTHWRQNHQPFHWFVEFYGIMRDGGFDVIIGNPPYVEYSKVKEYYKVFNYSTEECGDLYSFVMERSCFLLKKQSSFGMIVPISIVSTDGFASLRKALLCSNQSIWFQNFSERPSKLFTGVEKRLTIWLAKNIDNCGKIYSSKYRRWFSEERSILFDIVEYAPKEIDSASVNSGALLQKVGSNVELGILDKLSRKRKLQSYYHQESSYIIYYTRKLRYFIQFLDFVPKITNKDNEIIKPSELKTLSFSSDSTANIALSALNSNLFFWYFCCHSDVRNVNKREIDAFGISMDEIVGTNASSLIELSEKLMVDFQGKSVSITCNYGKFGILIIQSFQPRESKNIIDEIDINLAQHYGFTEEELDFIINYDIKYRMGQSGEEEE